MYTWHIKRWNIMLVKLNCRNICVINSTWILITKIIFIRKFPHQKTINNFRNKSKMKSIYFPISIINHGKELIIFSKIQKIYKKKSFLSEMAHREWNTFIQTSGGFRHFSQLINEFKDLLDFRNAEEFWSFWFELGWD